MPTYANRKTGHEVEAVKAIAEGTLITPDGEAHYIPGDYVVTLPDGSQFVGKPKMFEFKYAIAEPPGNPTRRRKR